VKVSFSFLSSSSSFSLWQSSLQRPVQLRGVVVAVVRILSTFQLLEGRCACIIIQAICRNPMIDLHSYANNDVKHAESYTEMKAEFAINLQSIMESGIIMIIITYVIGVDPPFGFSL